jgi:hypothetical protein
MFGISVAFIKTNFYEYIKKKQIINTKRDKKHIEIQAK